MLKEIADNIAELRAIAYEMATILNMPPDLIDCLGYQSKSDMACLQNQWANHHLAHALGVDVETYCKRRRSMSKARKMIYHYYANLTPDKRVPERYFGKGISQATNTKPANGGGVVWNGIYTAQFYITEETGLLTDHLGNVHLWKGE